MKPLSGFCSIIVCLPNPHISVDRLTWTSSYVLYSGTSVSSCYPHHRTRGASPDVISLLILNPAGRLSSAGTIILQIRICLVRTPGWAIVILAPRTYESATFASESVTSFKKTTVIHRGRETLRKPAYMRNLENISCLSSSISLDSLLGKFGLSLLYGGFGYLNWEFQPSRTEENQGWS